MTESSPLLQFFEAAQGVYKAADLFISRNQSQLLAAAGFFLGIDILDRAGWLPHVAVGINDFVSQPDAAIPEFAEARYRERSAQIEVQLLEAWASMGLPPVVAAPLAEAVDAHRRGLYRSSTRLVFPALEALERTVLVKHRWGSQTRLPELRKLIQDEARPVSFPRPMLISIKLWEKLHQHCFDKVDTPEAFQRFAASEIPNRHACVHGIIDYQTFQHSMNSLILAGYVVQMTELVRLANA